MHFLHIADIHLGYQQYGLSERFNDFSHAFLHLIDEALARQVDFVLLAGDLFEKRRRKQEKALHALETRLTTLPRAGDVQAVQAEIAVQQQTCAERKAALAEANAEIETVQVQRAELETALVEAETQRADLETLRTAQRQARDELERRLRALPRPAEVDDLIAQSVHQETLIAEKRAAVAELAGAPEDVTHWMQTLAELGDPRKTYQGAAAIARRRSGVEQQQAGARERQDELTVASRRHTAALRAYDGLDDRLAATRAALTTHEPAHRRYLQHIREAETLDERRDAVAKLAEKAAAAETTHAEQVAERDAVARTYNADAYTAIAADHARLNRELAGLIAQLKEQHKQQETLQAEIARLHEVRTRLEATRADLQEHQEVLALLEHLRRVLRDAGPEITRALVEIISLQADRLYADIMQDTTARLRWTDDYDVVLNTGGQARNFQQLSGGEQMAAALAVRLALLREISTIDVAFFDEPTANLDRDRRANLAAQILNVKGFAQLFVISHDDTFEQDTDHVVHIVKDEGAS
ncbi:MAG: AAA family ATPase, partial [Anaerolineae bacterium]|nr:AAA family ATPase [Anaerolineae bacterium]